MVQELTQAQKVRRLYNLIGERGLYVSTNFDVFSGETEEIEILNGSYKMPIVKKGARAYNSNLLFATITSLLNHGTMLVTGAPGIGKTTGLEFAGHFFSGQSLDEILEAEILGNPQLKTEDVIASLDTVKMVHAGEKLVLPSKFLNSRVKIWDEINRTPAELVSSAMKLVDTGKANYQGVLLQSPKGPLCATANYADEGTFQLTPPFLDRFDVAVMTTSPQPWDLKKIRQRGDEKLNGGLDELLVIPEELTLDFEEIRRQIKSMQEETEEDVPIVSTFCDFLYSTLRFSEIASDDLARATKGNAWQTNQSNAPKGHFDEASFTYSVNELSIRTVKAMERYSKAFAWINGKSKVELSDFKQIAPYLLWHKVQPTDKAIAKNAKHTNDRIAFIGELIKNVETEYEEMQSSPNLISYAAALEMIRTGKRSSGEDLNEDTLRTIIRNVVAKVGSEDKPYALTLSAHIISEYNARYANNLD